MDITLELIAAADHAAQASTPGILILSNDADVSDIALDGVTRIDLHFPSFADGRAFSQAVILRRRGFAGDIRALGDVLIDQLLQMQRCGFSSAVLRADQDAAHGQRLMQHYSGFYQGDIRPTAPRFAQASA